MGELITDKGKLFHSLITDGKNENIKFYLEIYALQDEIMDTVASFLYMR